MATTQQLQIERLYDFAIALRLRLKLVIEAPPEDTFELLEGCRPLVASIEPAYEVAMTELENRERRD